MKKKTAIISVILFVIILILVVILVFSYYSFLDDKGSYENNQTFVIANWNMQIFGDKKAQDTELMNLYADVIRHYDIIFLQEIRDKDASSFHTLCSMLPDYDCNISSRAGRSSSKEQYGIIYLKRFSLTQMKDHNPDSSDRWERPPIRADFSLEEYSFSVYNIHTKPNETGKELGNLESLINSENNMKNIILLGDLNADCYYYNPYKKDFPSWKWIIKDSDDTTTTPSDCAYDRIIINGEMYNEYLDYGIYTENIDEKVSDHYPVWIRIRDGDYVKDTSMDAFIKYLWK